jgi:uncharacterized protein (DUF362 family)/NAD-dependent dihydropyrimidine dehydrogenase PreA subunit
MGKTPVAIVSVRNGNIKEAVKKTIDLLGGINSFIEGAKKVLLKPNLLMAPEDERQREMIRTDPRILEALTELINGEYQILIGDCSGVVISGGSRAALRRSGYLSLGDKKNVTVHSLEKNGPIKSQINGKRLKEALVSKDFLEADAVINIPKMKTHSLTLYTGAIKNLYGTITGGEKRRIHVLGNNLKGFSQCLVDIYSFEKEMINLNVMDAVIAMEGLGPSTSGTPVEMNLILASPDAIALDAVAASLMGLQPLKVPMIKFAAEQNLGVADLSKIQILGEPLKEHTRKFKLPSTRIFHNLPLNTIIYSLITNKPIYDSGCVGCRVCEKACPMEVITIVKNKDGNPKPIIDYSGCISCFTCSEMCPNACYKEKSGLTKLGKGIIGIISGLLIAGIIGLIFWLISL